MTTSDVIALATLIGGAMIAPAIPADSNTPDRHPLSDLVVTATRIERSVFDTPHAVTVLDRQAIEDANVSSTPDLFRYAEGVYMQKTNQGGGSPFISGLTGKQVLILIDGIRQNNSYFRFGPHQYLNTIDPAMIERIEVVRGPTSVLYGSDALGGTINIITRRRTSFAEGRDVDTRLEAQTQSAAEATSFGLQLEGNVGALGFIGAARAKDYGEVDGGGDIGEQVPSGYEERNADLKFNWRLGDNSEITFGNQYVRQYDVPKTSEVTLGDKLQFNYEPQERLLSYLELRSEQAGPFDAMALNVSHHRQREGEEIITRAAPNLETRELTTITTLGTSLQFSNRWGERQNFTYGLEYYHDDFDTSKHALDRLTGTWSVATPGTPDGATYESFGAYVQDEIQVSERAELIGGVRYSRFESAGRIGSTELSFDTDNVTASVNALYRLTPRLNLVAGIAQGFRAPNMEDFFGRVDFVSEIPNTALEPEESLTRELGLKYLTEPLSGEIFYFDTDYEGFIDRVTIAPGVRQRQNLADVRIRGVEGAVQYQWNDGWLISANATWTHGKDENTGEPVRRIPPLNGSVRLRHIATDRFWLEAAAVMASKQDRLAPGDLTDPRIPPGGTPGYAVFDLTASFSLSEHHQFWMTLENIGDKLYKTHGSGLYAPGRSLNVSYQIAFD
jgi:hemoglobin/transferrin/lactoferrin receptor protein